MNTYTSVTARSATRVARVVTGAPELEVGVHTIRPASMIVESGSVTIAGQAIGLDGTVSGRLISRTYSAEQVMDLPEWARLA